MGGVQFPSENTFDIVDKFLRIAFQILGMLGMLGMLEMLRIPTRISLMKSAQGTRFHLMIIPSTFLLGWAVSTAANSIFAALPHRNFDIVATHQKSPLSR